MIKNILKTVLTFVLLNFVQVAEAQDAGVLIKQGFELNNKHDYAGAIEKYKAALKLEPDNPSANYQMAFALKASGKGKEALPYLQKIVQSGLSAAIIGSSYELMGTIFDQSAQLQKAIQSYQKGIEADSASSSLPYNLGLAYFRSHQYAEAEKSAISAIKINPDYATSWRLYALVTFHQNKRAAALLGFCSFLWLEPNGSRSAEAYGNLQHILQGGALKLESRETKPDPNAEDVALNQTITRAVASVSKAKYPATTERFTEQLKAIFTAIGKTAEAQNENSFFHSQLADYDKLSQTPNMTAFAYYISQSADKTAAAWLNNHQQQIDQLKEWMKNSKL